MAAVAELLPIAAAPPSLEWWWYPVWQDQLTAFTPYAVYGNTADLHVGPQASLYNPLSANGRPYHMPDFMVFQAPPLPAPAGTKTVRLVMENKRNVSAGTLIAARLRIHGYLARAMNAVNNPHTVIYGVATAAHRWSAMAVTNLAGPGMPPNWNIGAWNAPSNVAAVPLRGNIPL